jgi:hypothetical protein
MENMIALKLGEELSKQNEILSQIYPSNKMIPDYYDLPSLYLESNNCASSHKSPDDEVRIDVRLYARKNSTNPDNKYADGFTLGFFRNNQTKRAKKKFEHLPYTYHDIIINNDDSGSTVHLGFLDPSDSVFGEKVEDIGRVGIYNDDQVKKSKSYWCDFYLKNALQITRLFTGVDFQTAYLERFNKSEFKINQAFKSQKEIREEDEKNAKEVRGNIVEISSLLFFALVVLPLIIKGCKG